MLIIELNWPDQIPEEERDLFMGELSSAVKSEVRFRSIAVGITAFVVGLGIGLLIR